VRASEKSSIIINTKSTMHFPLSRRWTRCVNSMSPKEWLKTRIFTYFWIAFHIFIAGNRRHFRFGTPVDYNKSQLTNDKLFLKWVWSHHVITLNFKALNIPQK